MQADDPNLPVVVWDVNRQAGFNVGAAIHRRMMLAVRGKRCAWCVQRPVSSWTTTDHQGLNRPRGLYVSAGVTPGPGGVPITVVSRVARKAADEELLLPGSPFWSRVRIGAESCTNCNWPGHGQAAMWGPRMVRLHSDLAHVYYESPYAQSKYDPQCLAVYPGSPHLSCATIGT